MDIKDIAKRLRDKQEFIDFQEYVIGKIEDLDTVSDLGSLTNEKAGELAKVRLLARQKLEEILSPFIDFSEKREYTEEERKAAAQRRGL